MSKPNPFGRGGWTPERLPSLSGQVAVITGANSGIGLEAAKELAPRGVRQIWLCRNLDKATAAQREVVAEHAQAQIDVVEMDLSDLDSVQTASNQVRQLTDGIDAVLNNAGIMMLPERQLTAQGFETQLGVNHLGHFALNGRLADLVESRGGRFVSVSSFAHKSGRLHRDNLMLEGAYGALRAYSQSKLANLLYIRGLDSRLKSADKQAIAIACHPGYSATNLQTTGPGKVWGALMSISNAVIAQKAERGAWPTLLSGFETDAVRGEYYGPTGFGETRGAVGVASRQAQACDDESADWLWARSVDLTGVDWGLIGL